LVERLHHARRLERGPPGQQANFEHPNHAAFIFFIDRLRALQIDLIQALI
jgi:hypothetical protein